MCRENWKRCVRGGGRGLRAANIILEELRKNMQNIRIVRLRADDDDDDDDTRKREFAPVCAVIAC